MENKNRAKLEAMLVEVTSRVADPDITAGEIERLEKQIRVIKLALS